MSYHLPFEVFHNTIGEGMAVEFVDKNGSCFVKVQFGEKTAEFAYPEQFCFHLRAINPLVQAEILRELVQKNPNVWKIQVAYDDPIPFLCFSEEKDKKFIPQNVTEVVAALIWKGDKFMICQRPAHKARGLLWEFVGGKVEPGETKEQALIRECQEELAVTLSVGDVFMDVVHEYPDLTVHLTLFNATIADGEPLKLEHNDIQWITPSEIPNYEFCPADEEILERIKLIFGQ